jgi:hypothetical protein
LRSRIDLIYSDGGVVSDYRLYCLGIEGRIVSADWLDAQSDEEAMIVARSKPRLLECEVWHRDGFVGKVDFAEQSAVNPDEQVS